MVKSNLHKDIQYKETYAIDLDDIGFETSIYEITLFNEPVEIALGKPKYEYSNKHVIYFNIYLLVNDEPVSKIGIYELHDYEMIHSIDEDDDFQINEKNVILYIKKDYYEKILKKHNKSTQENQATPPRETTTTTTTPHIHPVPPPPPTRPGRVGRKQPRSPTLSSGSVYSRNQPTTACPASW